MTYPRVAYLPYVLRGAMRDPDNQFVNPLSPEEFLDSFEFGTPFYNEHVTDFYLRYFHMITVTEKYIIAPLNALKIDMAPMLEGVFKNTLPLSEVSLHKNILPENINFCSVYDI